MIGETVGSYRILSKLSVGGMGTVYRAEHALIGKLAAVKVLHPELSTNRDIINRFFNEAKATTSIKHPGIVEVFDFGYMASGHAFLVMEFLEGMSLAHRCETGGTMGEGDAAMLLRGVCSALSAAHAKGIVHRDLKPDNIFLVPDPDSAIGERPKLLDFGIAKLTDIGLAGTATKTGAVMGTPTYMSPEQCRGAGVVDHRADLYSIGCIFFELLTGKPPFTSLGAGELIGEHLYVEPPRPSELLPTISRESEKLILALLAKDPAHRPQTSKELGARFQEIASLQGWITHTSPAGITALSMQLLTPPPGALTDADRRSTREETVDEHPHTLPSKPPGATTPHGLTEPALFTPSSTPQPSSSDPDLDAVADRGTTLSGAASQSIIDVPRRSRKGLGLALAAAALIAGSTVAFIKLNGRPSKTAAATSPVATSPAISVAAPSVDTTAVVEAEPVVETKPVPETKPAVTDTKPAVGDVETKPAATTTTVAAPPTAAQPAARKPAVADTQPVVAETKTVVETKPAARTATVAATPTAAQPAARKPQHVEARPALKSMPKADRAKPDPVKARPVPPKPDPKKPLFETDI